MLEVRLLYRRLAEENERLERKVQERTAELAESEARFRSLTELAADWFWEQDINGAFTRVSGPVLEMLGIKVDSFVQGEVRAADAGWNETEREALLELIAAREPFLDFILSQANANGSTQRFQVSGEPMFDRACRFVGYRGVGIELTGRG
jgi:PAS domain S-box-containing protein